MLGATSQYAVLILVVTQALVVGDHRGLRRAVHGGGRRLQYLDQRMRKEAYDVELMTQAGITRS